MPENPISGIQSITNVPGVPPKTQVSDNCTCRQVKKLFIFQVQPYHASKWIFPSHLFNNNIAPFIESAFEAINRGCYADTFFNGEIDPKRPALSLLLLPPEGRFLRKTSLNFSDMAWNYIYKSYYPNGYWSSFRLNSTQGNKMIYYTPCFFNGLKKKFFWVF